MASSRRLPTTPNTSTYDSGGGRDYATLQGWEEATDIDLTAGGQSAGEILDCYKGAHDDADRFDGATTDSSYFRVIKPADGEGHLDVNSGIPAVDGSMVAFVKADNPFLISIEENYSQAQDLVGKLGRSSTVAHYVFRAINFAGEFVGCMAIDGVNSGSGTIGGFQARVNGKVIDCLAHNNDGNGFLADSGNGYFYNCTAEGNGGDNFVEGAGTMIAKNCLADNPGGSDYSGGPTLTTCGSSDATGSAGLQNQTYTFVNAGGDDFHYISGSDGIGDGTDLSGDGTYAFDDDIDEDTRSAWDIGFDEFVAAVGAVPLLAAGMGNNMGSSANLMTG